MRPVNLLPHGERPRAVASVPTGSSTAVLAVLAVLVLAVAGWVFTKNQVTDRTTAIAAAKSEKAAAEKRSAGLGSFGEFRQIKQTRVQSVTDLATKRFDWERFMRELALVLPDRVWLTTVKAGASADAASGAAPASGSASTSGGSSSPPAATSSSPPAGAGAAASSAGPSVQLTGCAPSQRAVAATMVRLRQMHGADDVDLKQSEEPVSAGGSGAGAPSSPDSSSSGGAGCGKKAYEFDASVTFAPPAARPGPRKAVPPRLGGGA